MDLSLIAIGVLLLLALAVAVGLAEAADRSSRKAAWRKVAEDRRRNHEERELVRRMWDEMELCRDCPYRRRDG